MSDSVKRINDGSFRNTIRMTLTTGGQLGVGTIDPKWTITSAGMVQATSILPEGIPILMTTGGGGTPGVPALTGKGMRVGLSTYNGDVQVLIGNVVSDGTNSGGIQVSSGGSGDGKLIGLNAYHLSLQPSGGNVGIGMTQPTSRLQVNGNIRTDIDFVTGTDTPGWVYHPIQQYEVAQSLSGSWPSAGYPGLDVGGAAFTKAHVSYKIIGKTVYIGFRFTWPGVSAHGSNSWYTHMKLPQLNFKDYNSNVGTTMTGHSDSIGWVSANVSMAMRVSLRKYSNSSQTAPGYLNQWILVFDRIDGSPGQNFIGATFAGQIVAELV